ncbi:RNA polymerase sigma-70 factor [Flexithrix dorotheae]|uniref:RNA polymerase sigma-70 factor n=1 Tax=Flexithrix dorotheae TaxID=70993 RepID=UPI00037FCD85|nr:RNA polymerase sigma-70 factor [Flexithrix dorotheae]
MENLRNWSKSLSLIAKGNKREFKVLFDFYLDELCDFANNYLHSPELAEEVVCDVFIKIWEKRKRVPEIQNIKSYLYKAVKNQSLKLLEKESKFPHLQSDTSFSSYVHENLVEYNNPESALLYNSLYKEIDEAIESLPFQCKTTFKMVKENGLKYKEVAEILNISVNTVENHMGKALKRLRKRFQEYLRDDSGKGGKVIKLAITFLFLLAGKLFLNFFEF